MAVERETPFGSQLPAVHADPPGDRSLELARRLQHVESRNVTHLSPTWPVFWEEALAANVRDVDGNVYVDLTSAFGVSLLGHRPPDVVAAIGSQSDLLIHGMGDIHPPAVKLELLERLCALAPWDDARVILSTTGSGAVESALKTAQLASGRPGIIAFEGGYHGLTLGSLAATDRDHFRAPFRERLYGGVRFAPFPTDPSSAEASLRAVEALLTGSEAPLEFGTVVVEPVQARGGAHVPPPGFMDELSTVAGAHGALVVADEIFTGLGRCGALFASELVGLRPDVVCVGKALGGGLPISACLAPASVMDAWPPSSGEAIHTSSFLGHPLACAAALAALDTIERDGVFRLAREKGARIQRLLEERLSAVPQVVEVRGLGLLLGIELGNADSGTPLDGAGAEVAEAALRQGVLVLPAAAEGHVVELAPPVVITDDQMEHAVDVLVASIASVLGATG